MSVTHQQCGIPLTITITTGYQEVVLDTPQFIVLCELLAYTNNIQFFETPGQGQWWYLHAMSEAEVVGGAAARGL